MLSIDLAHEQVDFLGKFLVLPALLSRWDSNLDQVHSLFPLREGRKELVESAEFVRETLDIVHAIHADNGFHATKLLFQSCDNVSHCVLD